MKMGFDLYLKNIANYHFHHKNKNKDIKFIKARTLEIWNLETLYCDNLISAFSDFTQRRQFVHFLNSHFVGYFRRSDSLSNKTYSYRSAIAVYLVKKNLIFLFFFLKKDRRKSSLLSVVRNLSLRLSQRTLSLKLSKQNWPRDSCSGTPNRTRIHYRSQVIICLKLMSDLKKKIVNKKQGEIIKSFEFYQRKLWL